MSDQIIGTTLTAPQAETIVAAYRAPNLSKHAEVIHHIEEDGYECVGIRVIGTDTDIVEMIATINEHEAEHV